ncbi:MAG: ABC transporter ATP-binding protein [Desulfobacterales bacterium]|nr:ABC transporter ATP-binding protein [Desulfobacterales bacterium]
MSIAISIKNLIHHYGNSLILKDISFDINQGDFFVILGPNGSGKTTLLKIISAIEKLKNGQINIFENPIQEYSFRNFAKNIAFVPQSPPSDIPFNVSELVLMGRYPYLGMLGIEEEKDIEIAKQAMEFTKVYHLANRKFNQLSGGECQRVFIAKAICQQPKIMLLDEPTASLDISHQTQIMDLMEELKEKKGITVVMVSHDINLAAMYGNYILLMKNGDIVNQGSPNEVLNYENLEKTYGCVLLVDESPLGKYPRVTLVPKKFIPNRFF